MTSSVPCAEVEAHLPLYVGGDLEAPLAEVVALHLEGCRTCAVRLEALENAREELLSLARAPQRGVEVDLWPAVRAQLAEEGVLDPLGAGRQRAPILRLAAPFVGAAAAAVLALLVWQPFAPAPASVDGLGGSEGATGGGLTVLESTETPHVVPVASRLHLADPDLERLRAESRVFPADGLPVGLRRNTRGAGLSAVSDERLR